MDRNNKLRNLSNSEKQLIWATRNGLFPLCFLEVYIFMLYLIGL